jgi:hypothetical protein
MTANQRRPGFRLPWSSDHEGAEPANEPTPDATPSTAAATATAAPDATPTGADAATPTAPVSAGAPEAAAPASEEAESAQLDDASAAEVATPAETAVPAEESAAATSAAALPGEVPESFLRDLVEAMRGVAEEARDAGLADLRAQADAAVKQLEELAERRRGELRERADTDVAAVGEWAAAEADRIRREAESRVAARKAQLEEQLAAETRRSEAEAKALRERVAEYERELEAYHRQLGDIHDPAAFAAAAKRMPKPPALTVTAPAPIAATPATEPAEQTVPEAPAATAPATTEPSTNGTSTTPATDTTAIHPAEEEVLAGRLAELDAELEAAQPAAESAAPVGSSEPMTTDVVVKGLGSFGAITGFRQSLASVAGIDGVALSLGSSGEFIFRTTHKPSVDVAAAITHLEGDGAKVERRPDGMLVVALDRAR